jgi:hypothetical protein
MTAAEIVALDARTLLVLVDKTHRHLESIDAGATKLSEVSHLLERAPRSHCAANGFHTGVLNAAPSARAAFPREPVGLLLNGYNLPRDDGAAHPGRHARRPRPRCPSLFDLERRSGWRLKASLASATPSWEVPSVVGTRSDLPVLTLPSHRR